MSHTYSNSNAYNQNKLLFNSSQLHSDLTVCNQTEPWNLDWENHIPPLYSRLKSGGRLYRCGHFTQAKCLTTCHQTGSESQCIMRKEEAF